MANTLPIEIFKILEDKLGRDEAVKVSSAVELCLETIDNKAKDTTLQKKLELKDELTRELATKADLILVKTELNAKIDLVKSELFAQQKLHFFIILFAIILASPKALELIGKIFNIIR